MLDVLVCIAVALLTVAVKAQAALTLRSSEGTACDVQYLVLHASIRSACRNQCSLLVASTPQPQLESLPRDLARDVISASPLLSTNVVTFQQPSDRHMMQIACQADSDCRASPKSWQIENTNSGIVAAALGMDHHHGTSNTQHVSCVQEVNSTVSIGVTGETADTNQPTPNLLHTNTVFKWSLRVAVLASVVILQLSGR